MCVVVVVVVKIVVLLSIIMLASSPLIRRASRARRGRAVQASSKVDEQSESRCLIAPTSSSLNRRRPTSPRDSPPSPLVAARLSEVASSFRANC